MLGATCMSEVGSPHCTEATHLKNGESGRVVEQGGTGGRLMIACVDFKQGVPKAASFSDKHSKIYLFSACK